MNNDKVGFHRSDLSFLLHFCTGAAGGVLRKKLTHVSPGVAVMLTLAQNKTAVSLLRRIYYSDYGEFMVPKGSTV